MDERTKDRHSVNCFDCGCLVDERECSPGVNYEGSICSKCLSKPIPRLRDALEELVEAHAHFSTILQNVEYESGREGRLSGALHEIGSLGAHYLKEKGLNTTNADLMRTMDKMWQLAFNALKDPEDNDE